MLQAMTPYFADVVAVSQDNENLEDFIERLKTSEITRLERCRYLVIKRDNEFVGKLYPNGLYV